MRPLTRDDYLLIAIVVAAAIAGMGAFLVALYNVLEEIRDRRQRRQHPATRLTPGRLPQRAARSAYRVSVIRH
jgi:hypothetical protein